MTRKIPSHFIQGMSVSTLKTRIVEGLLLLLPIILLFIIIFAPPSSNIHDLTTYQDDKDVCTLKDGTKMRFSIKKHITPISNSGSSSGKSGFIVDPETKLVFNLESQYTPQEIICDNRISEEEKTFLSENEVSLTIDIGKVNKISCWVLNTKEKFFSVFKVEYSDFSYGWQDIEKVYLFNDLGITAETPTDFELSIWRDKEQVTAEGRVLLQSYSEYVSTFANELVDNSLVVEDQDSTQIDLEVAKEGFYQRDDKDRNKINDFLDEKIRVGAVNLTTHIIIAVQNGKLNDVKLHLESIGGNLRRIFEPDIGEGFYGLAGVVPSTHLAELAENPFVELVEEDSPVILHADIATQLTQLRTFVWDTLNYTGDSNSSIAIIDTGLDDSHPMLNGFEDAAINGSVWIDENVKIVGWYDVKDSTSSPEDFHGHGSHCGGIATGFPYNSTVSSSDNRVKSTQGYTYETNSDYSNVYIPYFIDVKSTGMVNITYHWEDKSDSPASAWGTRLYLYAPNGTLIAQDVDGSNPMTVLKTVTETGLYKVACCWSSDGFALDKARIAVSAVNKYPYDDLSDGYERFSGVAPKTKLVGVKVFDRRGYGLLDASDSIAGINWVTANAETYHITVASMSFGYSQSISALDTAVTSMFNKGVLPIISAGNSGQGSGNEIYSPCIDEAILVAASSDKDSITSYSSEGPGIAPNTNKPDITAPGGVSSEGAYLSVDTNDADADNGLSLSDSPPGFTDQQNNDLAPMQGTSMACPHVAGIASLIVEAMGGQMKWDYDDITCAKKVKQLILLSGVEIYSLDRGDKDVVEGFGRINADAAIEALTKSYIIGNIETGTLSGSQFGKKVWARNVSLISGQTYSFYLDGPKNMDYDIFLYAGNPNAYGEPIVLDKSTNLIAGGDEAFTYTASTTGYHYIAVKYVSGSNSSQFTLRSESGSDYPSVSIINPAENTSAKGNLTIQISASVVDSASISSVQVMWAEDAWVPTAYNSSSGYYEFTFNTTLMLDANYTFIASVTDSNDKTTFDESDNIIVTNDVTGSTLVLVVDDDDGQTYELYYTAALDALGMSYDTTTSSPSTSTMNNYDAVIWFTGDDSTSTLSNSERTNIGNYLTGGGKMFLCGQDIFNDLSTSPQRNWLKTYFQVSYDGPDGTGGTAIIGQSSSIFSGKAYILGDGDGADNNRYPDGISADTNGTLLFKYNTVSMEGAAVSQNSTGKSVFFAFAFESISFASERQDCLQVIMNFLDVFDNDPSITITNSENHTQSSFSLIWSGNDDKGISYYHIFLDGISYDKTQDTQITINTVGDREHTIRVLAVDSSGNRGVDVYSFFVDSADPVISITSPANNTHTKLNQIAVEWTGSDTGSGIDYYEIFLNVTSLGTTSSENRDISLEEDGSYNITIVASDKAGNIDMDVIWVIRDTIDPIIDTINVTSSISKYIQLIPYPLNPTGGTCYFNSAADQGAGQILNITVTWTETNMYSFIGESGFGDSPSPDTNGADGWVLQYSVEEGSGSQGNILFTVMDKAGNIDTASIIFENDDSIGVTEYTDNSIILLLVGVVLCIPLYRIYLSITSNN